VRTPIPGHDDRPPPESALETVMELLGETRWDGPVEELRPVRNRICRLAGAPAPAVAGRGEK
jgi:hypothetical protein